MKFNDYKDIFVQNVKDMEKTVLEFPWDNTDVYQAWLSQTYYIVRHTSHFVCLAAALVPVENRLEHYHLIEHLKEEANHDLLLVSDLDFFDKKFDQFSELPETALVWQNLYYWLSLRKPRSILGHSLCIEGLAGFVGSQLVSKLAEKYPDSAIQFLKVHFEADKKHFEDGIKLMSNFHEDDLNDILKVQQQSSILYLNMLRKIKDKFSTSKQVTKMVA